ncbi:CLUMA_CG005008, isoform A [Clunio marinus]|uniref:CLUMA_CG005008, isoform A n=1 Tax=Clunio marinus TaxID=568069 RepID=A0A1J1HXT5_9DIPT|nr:CLUMA_CG005008, isoform A [Clunio marinus]
MAIQEIVSSLRRENTMHDRREMRENRRKKRFKKATVIVVNPSSHSLKTEMCQVFKLKTSICVSKQRQINLEKSLSSATTNDGKF